ncbi:MAG: sigma-70 family RNA polymerase sigma factor [Verrucomicrobiales bacterium]|nr:sigma-70 family RNA polymerase sigma factor [Verrucomicrobiales bacterium]
MKDFDTEIHDRFLRLYVREEESLRGFVRSFVPTLEDAREVMQEVAVVLWKKFDSLDDDENFRRWAFGVARLEALQYRRRIARDRLVLSESVLEVLADEAEELSENFDAERRALQKCLGELPAARRALVEQAYAPGVRIDELAADMGKTAMSLYKKLHRLRQTLIDCTRKSLQKEGLA